MKKKRWKVSLRMPARHTKEVARHLALRKANIEHEYAKTCLCDSEVAQEVKVVSIVQRARSVLVVVESGPGLAVNTLSEAIMRYLPSDCREIQVPFWS